MHVFPDSVGFVLEDRSLAAWIARQRVIVAARLAPFLLQRPQQHLEAPDMSILASSERAKNKGTTRNLPK